MWRLLHLDDNKITRRMGRRALLLIIAGLVWFGIGVSLLLSPLQNRFAAATRHPINGILRIWEAPATGILWVGCGIIALCVGILHTNSSVRRHDAVGFNAILTPAIMWAIGYAWSAVAWLSTDGQAGHVTSIYGFLVWVLVALFIMIIAGWPEEDIWRGDPRPPGDAP